MLGDRLFHVFERTCDPRPLALFRVCLYSGLALHFGPSLIWLEENYSAAAYRSQEWNPWLFAAFDKLPSSVVMALAILTGLALLAGLVGLHARGAAVATAVGLYTFASFNALNVQSLALILTWALLWIWAACGTGDEVWSLKLGRAAARPKPTAAPALCRALIVAHLMVGLIFAGVEKLLAGWPMNNEMHILLSMPGGFILRPWVAELAFFENEAVGMALSILTLIVELGLPLLLMIKRTRLAAFVVYQAFFLGIVAMLQVPPLFYAVYAGCGFLVLSDEQTRRIFGTRDESSTATGSASSLPAEPRVTGTA